jgi:hypothetical protein
MEPRLPLRFLKTAMVEAGALSAMMRLQCDSPMQELMIGVE